MNHRLVFNSQGRDGGSGDQSSAERTGIAEAREDGEMARWRGPGCRIATDG
jgi:hypothetical protein